MTMRLVRLKVYDKVQADAITWESQTGVRRTAHGIAVRGHLCPAGALLCWTVETLAVRAITTLSFYAALLGVIEGRGCIVTELSATVEQARRSALATTHVAKTSYQFHYYPSGLTRKLNLEDVQYRNRPSQKK